MAKIHIVGGPGSGKTTLGRALATRFQVPHYDLDLHGQKNGMRHEAWVADAVGIAQQPGWITENVGIIYIVPLLAEAEHIVMLDVTWPVAAWRIVSRHVVASLRGTNRYPGFKPLVALLAGSRRYYLNLTTRPETGEMMQRYLEQQRTSPLRPTPEELIKELEAYSDLIIPPTQEFVRLYLKKYQEKVVVIKTKRDRARFLTSIARSYQQ